MSSPGERTNETERRRATVLFADITGFTTLNERLDAEQAYTLVTSALKLLDSAARKYGGSVDKYLGDAVMAVFGVPLAMEEAPKAAINAAIEMRNRIAEFNQEHSLQWPLEIHSGINTGLMISGDISGPVLREFAVMGDAVNIAARLKDLAPKGEIWVGEETWRYAQLDFEFAVIAPLTLKGKEKTVAVYQVQTREERPFRRPLDAGAVLWSRLEGRERELDHLRGQLRHLVDDKRGAVVSLVGEAGLGKSRLVLEARAIAEADGLAWWEGRSVAVGTSLSYYPIRDLLRRWAGIDDKDDDVRQNAKLAAMLGTLAVDAGEIHPFVALVMGLRLTAVHGERVLGIEGEALEHLIRNAVGDLLRAAAILEPRVLVLEDLHWADQSSLGLLQSLIPLTLRYPVLLVCVMRPGFPAADTFVATTRAQCGRHFSELRLEPLPPRATQRVIDNYFANDVPAGVRDAIESKAAGNPFYIEEVMRMLVDEGGISLRDGRLRATGKFHDIRIPGSLQEVVMTRIDRLDIGTKRVLQVISVAGDAAPHETLAAVSGDDNFTERLGRLIELEFLEAHDRNGRQLYRFKHPLIQEVCYDGILRSTRQELHSRTAHALQTALPEQMPGLAAILAYHFARANDLTAGEQYLFRAGDEAAGLGASSEELAFFREAARSFLALYGERGDPQKRATLEAKVGLAYFRRGQHLEAVEHINRALALYRMPMPEGRLERALRLASSAAVVLGKLYVVALRGNPQPAGEREHAITDLMIARARAQTTTGSNIAGTVEAMRFVWSVDPRSLRGAAGLNAAAAGGFAYSGFFGPSERYLALAREHLDRADVSESFQVHSYEFIHHFLAGTRNGIREIDPGLVQANIRQGQLWDVSTYLGLLVKRCVYQGRFSEAAEHIEHLKEIEERYGYELARENWHGGEAYLALERGAYGAAAVAADRYFTDNREVFPNILALGVRAKAEVLAGHADIARRTLSRAQGLVASHGRVPPFHHSAYLRSCALLALAELDTANAAGDRAAVKVHERAAKHAVKAALHAAQLVSWRRPEAYRLAARLALVTGNQRRASTLLERALEEAAALGLRPEGARAHAAAAALLARSGRTSLGGQDVSAHRAAATTEMIALGLERDLADFEAAYV